jgi:aflatoxin B1 aldehyde reductase
MTVGLETAPGTRVTSRDEFNKCLDLFQSQGFTEIDTSRLYCGGQQEAFTREAQWKERQLQVATK